MYYDPTKSVPKQCYDRVRVMLFLDRSFDPSFTKSMITSNQTSTKFVEACADGKLRDMFVEWLEECHETLDKEM